MPAYDYAEKFTDFLAQKYSKELCSYELEKSNPQVQFLNAQTIKLPRITVSGYKDHVRGSAGGFNAGTLSNDWEPKKLSHDRDIEFVIDPMDIDETNLVLSMANIQNTFETEQAIPEKDSYRFSKLYSELSTYKAENINTTTVTAENFLTVFDEAMCNMDDAAVPSEGRIIYVTPSMYKIIKNAQGIERSLSLSGGSSAVNRNVHSLDDVTIKSVPSTRLKTAYNFTDGCVADSEAKQINFILIHPSCVVCRDKYSYIKLFTPGSDSRTADNYIYQNRAYGDLFLLQNKAHGAYINVEV